MASKTSLAAMLVVAGLVCLRLTAGVSHAEDAVLDYEQVSAVLFPETSGWTAVNSMKNADEKWLVKNEKALRQSYLDSALAETGEDADCSFIESIFLKEEGYPDYFFIHDMDADGFADVLYTGPAQCSESDATLIWFGVKGGYAVKQDALWNTLALRVKEGGQLQVSSVAIACCDSAVDEYLVGDLTVSGIVGDVSITSDTVIPPAGNKPARFTSGGELALRASPEVDDAYDKDESGHMDTAVFGNVLSKYLPGCTGTVLSTEKDDAGRTWCFVELDDTSNPLRTHDPYEVNAGWVESRYITVSPTD
ncbi:MAG: hypothetical protein HZC51_06005 [Nitrospirae bacterium]|nr:hypothetical protein [Nitrospirota bacterium]